jgi:hypothetical protein
MRKSKTIGFIQSCDIGIDSIGVRHQPRAIYLKEGVCHRKGNPLVAINEGMVLGKAFPQGRRLLDQVRVISRLGPEQRRFKKAGIADVL